MLIVLFAILLLFGAKRLTELSSSLDRGVTGFEERLDFKEEHEKESSKAQKQQAAEKGLTQMEKLWPLSRGLKLLSSRR